MIIGIDGGGTKCRAGLYDLSGNLLASSQTGPANLYSDYEGALHEINQASQLLVKKYGNGLAIKDCTLSLGCAGASVDSVKKRFASWEHGYIKALLTTDVHISCLAANHTQDCVLMIAGTGSCIAVYKKNQIRQFGGHGFLLGDIGSGAWLGKRAVSWYMQALDLGHNDSTLFKTLELILGSDASEVIERFGQASASTFAALVPNLLKQAKASPVFEAWLAEGTQYFVSVLKQNNAQDLPLFFDGGLKDIYIARLQVLLNKPINNPIGEATKGAYYFAQADLARASLG